MQDVIREPSLRSDPIRGFSWKRDQGHRPGLTFMVSTGRHHGTESTEEARVLLALDFAADVTGVISQPFRLRFDAARQRVHTPDFLVETPGATWLLDVRPEPLIEDKDLESFAAAAEMALACGWHYRIAARWRENAWAALDAFSSQRRGLSDPYRAPPGPAGRSPAAAGDVRGTGRGQRLRARGPGSAPAPALAPEDRGGPFPAAGRQLAGGGLRGQRGPAMTGGAVLDLSRGPAWCWTAGNGRSSGASLTWAGSSWWPGTAPGGG